MIQVFKRKQERLGIFQELMTHGSKPPIKNFLKKLWQIKAAIFQLLYYGSS